MAQKFNEVSLEEQSARHLANALWSRKIKQKDLADMLFVSTRTVRRWMYEGIPNLNEVQRIANALQMSPKELLFPSEGEDPFENYTDPVQGRFFVFTGHIVSCCGHSLSLYFSFY